LRFDTEGRMIVRSPREFSGYWGEAGGRKRTTCCSRSTALDGFEAPILERMAAIDLIH